MSLLINILLPIVPIYFLVTWLRNKLYDFNIFKSKSYEFPVICVGNLSAGGTGKTPMTEYLISLLKDNYKLSVLSRGYGRKTSGFILADTNSSAEKIGDEPFQFYTKFKDDIKVAVCENRQNGIENLQAIQASDIILLDDAYQHRKVKAGFYILLTTYDNLYIDDMVLPTGDLREPRKGAERANCVVVTKCPENLSNSKKNEIAQRLKLNPDQELYFSTISYSTLIYSKKDSLKLEALKEKKFTLVTGIANASLLVDYLKKMHLNFEHLNYKDHHEFSGDELKNLETKEFILTTEKDYMRLASKLKNKHLFYLPIHIEIDKKDLATSVVRFIESF